MSLVVLRRLVLPMREVVNTLLRRDLKLVDEAMGLNSIMKKVTSWAAIIAVPTAVTGFYGMNVPYPGFAQHSGFVASVVLLVVLSGGLYLLFKCLDWL